MKILKSLLLLMLLLLCGSALAAAPTEVMITVDVESFAKGNPGLQIWGKQFEGEHGGQRMMKMLDALNTLGKQVESEHGIGRMMDMLDAHGFKGTFYLNVYEASKFGESDIANAARTINSRGHDLELHTHPLPMFHIQYMQQASLEKQEEILKRGIELIRQWTGKTVIAHRAGGYAANLDTLKACRLVGLQIDHSFNPVGGDTGLAQQLPATNLPREIEGVLELPVTRYAQARVGNWQSLRYLDVEGSSYDEMVSAIRQFRDAGFPAVTIMMHSFSFVRYGKADPEVEQRFDNLLKFLATEPGVKVVTVSQYYQDVTAHRSALLQSADLVPDTGVWLMYRRAWDDFKGWKNIVVAVTPPGMLFIVGAIVIWWRRKKRKGVPAA